MCPSLVLCEIFFSDCPQLRKRQTVSHCRMSSPVLSVHHLLNHILSEDSGSQPETLTVLMSSVVRPVKAFYVLERTRFQLEHHRSQQSLALEELIVWMLNKLFTFLCRSPSCSTEAAQFICRLLFISSNVREHRRY